MKKVLSHIMAVALVILVSCFMPLFLFFTNISSIKFVEIAIFMGAFSAIGLILFAIIKGITNSEYKAATLAAIVTLIYQNIGRLQPLIGPWFVILLFAAIMVGIYFAAKKFLSNDIAKTFAPILTIMLALLCILNTVTSMSKIVDKANLEDKVKAEIDKNYETLLSYKDENETPQELPNVYFFIPDEYAGFKSSEKFLGYDNKEFKDFLYSNNFQISESSTNYSNGTLECLADVFNFEINEDNRYNKASEAYCQKKVYDSTLFRMVEDLGYDVRAFQPTDLVAYESETSQTGKLWSTTADGDLSLDLMLEPTICYPIKDAFMSVLDLFTDDASIGKGVIDKLATSNAEPLMYFASKDAEYRDSTFNFCYSLIPHQPFYFDEEGNLKETNKYLNDWSTKDHYLEQYKYSTKLLTQSIENIIENDPESIIIIMSDHGLRMHEVGRDTWMKDMTPRDNADIICAVYYKGEDFTDIEGLCGTNVLISVVNEAYGYDIPIVGQSDDFYFKNE